MSTKKEKTMPAEKKHIKKLIEGQLSTRQKVAKGFGIALVVIAALWGAFAAPIAVTYGGAPEAAIGFLFLALFFFLVSLPFLYLGRKRKQEITTTLVEEAKKGEVCKVGQEAATLPKGFVPNMENEEDNEEKVVEKEEKVIKCLKPSADASPPAWRQSPQDYNYKN